MRAKFVLLLLLLAPVLAACSNTDSASGRQVSFVGDTVVVKVLASPLRTSARTAACASAMSRLRSTVRNVCCCSVTTARC